MIPLNLVVLDKVSIFEQLQMEEALLRADERNWCLINTGSPPAIVVGISGKPEHLVDQDELMKQPLPLIRRFSGGGTVIVDPNTVFVTWICNAAPLGVACCPQKIHRWSEELYQTAFPSLDMQWMENDYVIGARKFGGNAQYLCKGRWLHHSSLLWDYEPERMRYLLMPSKTPYYRQGRQHHDFLCRLRPHFADKADLTEQLLQTIHKRFKVEETNAEEIQRIRQRPHRQATQYIAF